MACRPCRRSAIRTTPRCAARSHWRNPATMRRCRSMARFALHPALKFLHASYAAKELAVLHAVASPYRERSHFDGQNVLENGGVRPHGTDSGWINRAISALPADAARAGGVALGANVPLAMRGPAEVASWSPTKIAALDEETLTRLTDLYARDPLLSRRLAEALESDAIANEAQAAANAEAEVDAPMPRATWSSVTQSSAAISARVTRRPRAPRRDSSGARMDRASRCSTLRDGIRTPTRVVRRASSHCGCAASMRRCPRSRTGWVRCGATPWCWSPRNSAAPRPSMARAARITVPAPRHSC